MDDAGSVVHGIAVIVFLVLYLFPVARIIRKAGYSGWWCLLALVPLVNLIMVWVFAFASWPNLRENRSQ
jgi:uncharacterized membrane protein YhaH (DUF805 family)